MTEAEASGHPRETMSALSLEHGLRSTDRPLEPAPSVAAVRTSFEGIYDAEFDFVWRSLRRLGVPEPSVDDATQDVFVVVHRRLDDFEGRSSIRTWLFGIALRVARTYRRRTVRKGQLDPLPVDLVHPGDDPEDLVEKRRAAVFLDAFLESLDDDKRAVFVLAEMEQMTAPEIEEALGVKLNTVYSRLRAARRAFESAVRRHRARDDRAERT